MSDRVDRTPEAQEEIEQIAFARAQEREDLGYRFLDSMEGSLRRLAVMPGIGVLYDTQDPRLSGLRCARVDGFRNHVIYYRPTDAGIDVVRVLHAARDTKRLL